jgi:hypothetical protein
VIGEPPFDIGAAHDTDAWPLPGTADAFVGATGTTGTVCAADFADGELVPSAFVALTVHVYFLPAVSDSTEIGPLTQSPVGVFPRSPLRVIPRSLDVHVAVYAVMGLPPSPAAAKKATDPVVPVTENAPIDGAGGTLFGKTKFDTADGGPEPIALRAVTEQLYASPPVKPVTVIGLVPFVADGARAPKAVPRQVTV